MAKEIKLPVLVSYVPNGRRFNIEHGVPDKLPLDDLAVISLEASITNFTRCDNSLFDVGMVIKFMDKGKNLTVFRCNERFETRSECMEYIKNIYQLYE